MLSIILFSSSFLALCDIFLLICDILLRDCDNESFMDLIVSTNLFSVSLLSMPDKLSTRFYNESSVNL